MENKRRHYAGITFWEYEIFLAKKMLDSLRTTLEFLYYLMEHRSKATFSIILISSDSPHSMNELQRMKRGTDLLFELDKEHGTFAMVCQATDQEGGQQFAEILLNGLRLHRGSDNTYCILSTLDSTQYSVQEVIFKMVETYLHAKKIGQTDTVVLSDPAVGLLSEQMPTPEDPGH
jgi:hypothetical protein